MTRSTSSRTISRRDERGYAAVLVAILTPVVFIALSAIAVDTARWYAEMQRVQNAADAGALAGVTYMPQDLTSATSTAKTVTGRNGYTDGANRATVSVAQGDKSSQLKVTVTSTIDNAFGAVIGTPTTTVSRTAVADFTGPAPMGSPCNTFGNEPSSGGGASSATPTGTALPPLGTRFSNCASDPAFWATVEGPQTSKDQGDRYSTTGCSSSSVDGCDSGSNNTEYNQLGYFWVVKVQKAAVNQPINLQLYDPAFVNTGSTCAVLPSPTGLDNDMNPYTKLDGKARYGNAGTNSSTGSPFCPGDYFPGGGSNLMTTSFEVREQTDTLNPMKGAVVSGCTRQYTGATSTPVYNDLKSTKSVYDDQLSQVFHNWTSLCTFTPTREGDYYLRVRTNVSAGGSSSTNTNGNPNIIYSGNSNVSAVGGNTTTGAGDNSFGIRAVTASGYENQVSVSGYDRMPIFANATAATSTFNLIRVLPGAAGQFVSFSFFDAGDATSAGSVKVLPPPDATGSITTNPFPGSCRAVGGNAGAGATLTNCTAPIKNSTNNGKVETMSIPIPNDYSCSYTSNGGCWYRVQVSFPSGSVNDITTWDAQIVGDPVRLVK